MARVILGKSLDDRIASVGFFVILVLFGLDQNGSHGLFVINGSALGRVGGGAASFLAEQLDFILFRTARLFERIWARSHGRHAVGVSDYTLLVVLSCWLLFFVHTPDGEGRV